MIGVVGGLGATARPAAAVHPKARGGVIEHAAAERAATHPAGRSTAAHPGGRGTAAAHAAALPSCEHHDSIMPRPTTHKGAR